MRRLALLLPLLCAAGVVQAAPAAAIDAAPGLKARIESHGGDALIAQLPGFLDTSAGQGLCAVFAAATPGDSQVKTVVGLDAVGRAQHGAVLIAFSPETNS